jgi:hypothetical protein
MKTKTMDEKREMSNQTQKILVGFLPFLCLGFRDGKGRVI